MTDPKFLKRVQESGWSIDVVGDGNCVGKCPTAGCSMRALITDGKHIPRRVVENGPSQDISLPDYNVARLTLQGRRQGLGLTIREVEEVSGLADDHVAKFEPENWQRQPTLDTFITWAATLGFDVVLRPADLPPITLRKVSETRAVQAKRQRRFEIERQRDGRQHDRGGRSTSRSDR